MVQRDIEHVYYMPTQHQKALSCGMQVKTENVLSYETNTTIPLR